jgi:hypothetical protein
MAVVMWIQRLSHHDVAPVMVILDALRLERGDACAVLVELVLPESLVVASVILPVLLHVSKDLRLAVILQDLSDVRHLALRRTACIVRAIAVI